MSRVYCSFEGFYSFLFFLGFTFLIPFFLFALSVALPCFVPGALPLFCTYAYVRPTRSRFDPSVGTHDGPDAVPQN